MSTDLPIAGFSKYRPLLAALQPKTILIEEAAETLEAPVAVACVPSLQNLILVGDHQQLRPHTQVKAHEDRPYFLNVSLFERLVNNNVEFDTLLKQRRMIPEIRRLLFPIYKDKIKDHASVLNPTVRPNVPGMGGVNSFFFSHQWKEAKDDQMSCLNPMEAEMIVGFFGHLLYNGMEAEEITVLTFYNGQRKRILSELRHRHEGRKFNVVTVDSYQGEENKVVILSLVRSNDNNQIGFLNIDNRVCVALSRAQCGFYLFGNGKLLWENSKTWRVVVEIIAGMDSKNKTKHFKKSKAIDEAIPQVRPKRLNDKLPISCSNHGRIVEIGNPDEWENMVGGCLEPCGGMLPCGHACELKCHPASHELVNCTTCRKKNRFIPQDNLDHVNATTMNENVPLRPRPSSGSVSSSQSRSTESWKDFAQEEPVRVQKQVKSYRPSEGTSAPDLIDVNTADVSKDMKNFNIGLDGTSEAPTRTISGDGVRHRWTEMYAGNQAGHEKDWSREGSLLD